mmetsp:Transcript_41595/g.98614  ORF Transcript_41595/g.98614 Transcript_41595/m.98614 type:complete len:687 (-) Transcript_41595:207-2267(-)
MPNVKRSYKLQEFVAHSSNVNCLRIGRKSSGVLVTGGDDKKVNMWAIGKPNAILSLAGHQSPVDCVAFDNSEEVVAAGATSGTVKLWDLEEAKVVRTLTGHRSNCLSVVFHPFGEYLASGSLDTNLKIWDLRQRCCIHTYKGHTRGITHASFSPDGKWVLSGSDDGKVKLWDLTAGKLLHDFQHTHPVTGVEFHPSEFFLATSSMDRTVKFWDLETFQLADTAGPDTLPPRAIHFPQDGSSILVAQQDGLRVYGWEPAKQFDFVDVAWTKVADLSLHEGKLIGCSFNQTFVGVWVVDLTRVKPFGTPGRDDGVAADGDCMPHARDHEAPAKAEGPVCLPSPGPRQRRMGAGASPLGGDADAAARAEPPQQGSRPPSREAAAVPPAEPAAEQGQPKQMVSIGTEIGDSLPRTGVDMAALNLGRPSRYQPYRGSQPSPSTTAAASAAVNRRPATTSPRQGASSRSNDPEPRQQTPDTAPAASPGSLPGPQPKGLDVESFLPAGAAPPSSAGAAEDTTVQEVLSELLGKHPTMLAVLSTRSSNLQVVRGLWAKGDVRGALAALKRCQDQSVAADLLGVVGKQQDAFKLEHCGEVLPILDDLLASTHDQWQLVAAETCANLLKSYGQIIRSTFSAVSGIGPDMAMEARREKCTNAKNAIQSIMPRLTTLSGGAGEVALKAQSLLEEIKTL